MDELFCEECQDTAYFDCTSCYGTGIGQFGAHTTCVVCFGRGVVTCPCVQELVAAGNRDEEWEDRNQK